jgi:flagellum-specific peptidoglycan hydrolase FlgJ
MLRFDPEEVLHHTLSKNWTEISCERAMLDRECDPVVALYTILGKKRAARLSPGPVDKQTIPHLQAPGTKFYKKKAGASSSQSKLCNVKEPMEFIRIHRVDAAAVASELGVPTAFLLGLSGKESQWGAGRFAAQGNAFFNMEIKLKPGLKPTALPSYATGYLQAQGDAQVFVFTYPSYAASAKSFAEKYGNAVRGIQDPTRFLTALRNAGFNTADPDFTNPQTIENTITRMKCQ